MSTEDTQAAAGINQRLNFQGRLYNGAGAVIPDGDYNVEFKIVQDGDGCNPTSGTFPCSGTVQWTETRTGANKVTLRNGYFSVELGSVTALPTTIWNQDTLWLSVNIGGTGSPSWDGEMKPLKRLTSSPYALNAGQLGGLSSSSFIQLAQGLQTDVSTINPSIFVNKNNASGSPNILQLQKAGLDVLVVNNAGLLTALEGLTVLAGKNLTVNSEAFTDLTGNGLTMSGGALTLNLAAAANGLSSTVSSGSGMEVLPSGLSLLQGCGNGQVLQWNETTDVWACSTISTDLQTAYLNSTGPATITLNSTQEGLSIVDNASAISGALFAVKANATAGSGLLFSVTTSTINFQDAAGNNALVFDSTTSELKIYDNSTGPTNYASVTATGSDATFKSSSGTTKIGNGTGAISINAGSGAAVNITANAASVWQTTAGSLTIQAGTALSLLSTTSSAASLDSGSTGAVNIGTGASAKTVTVGSTTGASSLVLQAGSGNIVLGASTVQSSGSALTLDVSNGASDSTLNISNSGGAGNITLALDSGGAFAVGGSTGSSVTCANSQVLQNQAVTGGITTGGTCSGRDNLLSIYVATGTCKGSNIQVQFTGSADSAPLCSGTTLTLPSNTTKLFVQLRGGGGGGGAVNNANAIKAAGGGGEGGYVQDWITSVGSSYFYTVGTGGGGGAAGGNNGTAGNATCWKSSTTACTSPTHQASGGGGGIFSNAATSIAGGAGGAATGGDLSLRGDNGGAGIAGTQGAGGRGGGTGGGIQTTTAGAGAAAAADTGGGGAGGCQCTAATTTRAGGNGADGYVLIHVYTGATGADLAEWYETKEDVGQGDIVAVGGTTLEYNGNIKKDKQKLSILEKAASSKKAVLGVVSTAPYTTMDDGLKASAKHPQPIALNGRVPVNASIENGPIRAGDLLTLSSNPGVAMKALTNEGPIIGQALENFDQETPGTVMTFIKPQYLGTNKQSIENGWIAAAIASGLFVAGVLINRTSCRINSSKLTLKRKK